MKRIAAALVALSAMALVFSGCAKKEAPVPAAEQASGKVVIYTSMYEDIIEALDKVLKAEFPNIQVEFFYGGTGTLQAKVAAEMAAGKLGCDMLMVADPSYALELKELGILAPIAIPGIGEKLAHEYDKEGYWYPVRISNMILAYNPEKYKKADLPQSMYDFAFDKRVAGAVSKSNPLTSGTALASISALKDKYGYEYFTALGAQGVMIESGSVALTKLETGEAKVIMVLEESVLQRRQLSGSKLEVIYPTDGTINIPSPIMSVDPKLSANNNLAAAKVITEWFLSMKGQENIVKGWMHSVRNDYPGAPYDAIPTAELMKNVMRVDWVATYKNRGELRTKFQEAVAKK